MCCMLSECSRVKNLSRRGAVQNRRRSNTTAAEQQERLHQHLRGPVFSRANCCITTGTKTPPLLHAPAVQQAEAFPEALDESWVPACLVVSLLDRCGTTDASKSSTYPCSKSFSPRGSQAIGAFSLTPRYREIYVLQRISWTSIREPRALRPFVRTQKT